MIKRFFDFTLALLGLAFLFPLFLAIAILIKFEGRGPVFFQQKRVGRNFRTFYLYKFRSMVHGAPANGPLITVGGDPRVTRVGRILRKFKLDELPQLINVLKGDMSLVGPRPEVRKYVRKFRKDYRTVLSVRPGITDIASLTFRDEESVLKGKEDPEDYYVNYVLPEKIKLAKEYVNKASLRQDISLIVLTILKIAYPAGLIERSIESLSFFRRAIVILIELAVFVFANYFAFLIRFDGAIPAMEFDLFASYLPVYVAIRLVFLFAFSIDKGLWRYVSATDMFNIGNSLAVGSALFFLAVHYIFGATAYPKSIFVLDWFLNMFFLVGLRFAKKFHDKLVSVEDITRKRAIIVGAGDAAELLIRDISNSQYYPYKILGLVDDNPRKKGLVIRGLSVLGTRDDLPELIKTNEPDELILAIPSLSDNKLGMMVEQLRSYGIPVKVMPSLYDMLVNKTTDESSVFNTEDLLFREPVSAADEAAIGAFLRGRRVMVTGAGGSIGSELAKQIARFMPKKLILFDQHEASIYAVDMQMTNAGFEGIIVPVIGDVADRARVCEIMEKYNPEIIYHAAAYKHVPLMEQNSYEAFKTNVIGTRTVAAAAGRHGAERFILISTDKAVNPVNVMGNSKKMAEKIVMTLSRSGCYATKYMVVRFGNVLGSSGSVVPLFTEQIKRGGPVTVTHPDIIRFFMTIPEAVRLVLYASMMGKGSDVYVLDMGKPVKILDMAKKMISLHGYKPGMDIEIKFTGLRPGEKLYEELYNVGETILKTSHPKITMANSTQSQDELPQELLRESLESYSPEFVRSLLGR